MTQLNKKRALIYREDLNPSKHKMQKTANYLDLKEVLDKINRNVEMVQKQNLKLEKLLMKIMKEQKLKPADQDVEVVIEDKESSKEAEPIDSIQTDSLISNG